MGNTAKICLDLSGKYNKEEIDRVSEMLLEAADPEQQELFAIPVSHQIPAVFAAVCMSIFLAIDQEVAAKGAHSLNPEDLTERFINVIKRLALGYGVSKEEFNREGGFRDRAMEAIKEIGSFNLHLHSTGKTAGFFPAAQESDTISELIASPVPKNFDLEKVERRIRETAGPAQKQILSILDKHGISPIMGPRFELACDILLKGDMLTSGLIHSGGKVLAQDYAEIMGCQPIAKSEGELPVITAFEEFMAMARDSTLAAMGCENYAIN